MIAHLYGEDADSGDPFWVDAAQLNNENNGERILRRLLSRTGRKKRIVLIDNVTGYFKSEFLAQLVTQGSISGLPPYGHGEETRPNDLTWCLTSNSATVDPDLAQRSMFIHLVKPPNNVRDWENRVNAFIAAHRLQIIADIIGILKRGVSFEFSTVTRFRGWEREVLAPICGSLDNHSLIWKTNEDHKAQADGETDEIETLREAFRSNIEAAGFDPDSAICWLQIPVLISWCQGAIPGFGGKTGRAVRHCLRNMLKSGKFSELSEDVKIWPQHSPKHTRGMMWNHPVYAANVRSKVPSTVQIFSPESRFSTPGERF